MRRHGPWMALVVVLAGVPAGAAEFTLRGTVVGPAGAPVTEGTTGFGDFWGGDGEFAGRLEARIPEVPPGRYPLVYTDRRGGVLAFTLVPVAAGQREARVTLRVDEDLRAKGRVVSADMPDGVPNAQVTIEGTIDGKPWKCTPHADEHGGFALYGKALAGFTVTATAPYHQPSRPATIAAPFPTQMELRLPRQTMIIGQVLTEEGSSLGPGATIAVFTKGYMTYAESDQQGRVEFEALPPGDYTIWAFAPSRMPQSTTLRLAPEQQVMGLTLRLPFAPASPVSGNVVGPDGKTAVSGATVEFTQMLMPPPGAMPGGFGGGFMPKTKYTAVSRPNGYYSVMLPVLPTEMVPPQTYVTIKAEGYLPRYYVVYREALFAGAVDFRVFRGGRLHGTVRMLDGRPLPEGTRVTVQVPHGVIGPPGSGGGSVEYAATLDPATGSFDFGLVQPGEDWVLVEAHGDRLSQTKVTVKEGEDSQLEDVAVPPGMVHGEATGAEEAGDFGDPKAPIRVEVYAPLSLEWHQKTIALLREYDRQHPGRIFVRLMPMGDAAYDAEMQKRGFIAAVIFVNGEHAFTLPDGRRVDLQKRPNGEGSSYKSEDVIAVVEGIR